MPYQNSSIGEAAVDEMVKEVASRAVLHGVADAKHFVGIMYVERYGSVIEGLRRDKTGRGLDELAMKNDRTMSSRL
ncbi:MAG: hypothetical protein AAB886_00355, partial [Patescibacteria group bacterium]